jgi:hypothetical protein
MSQISWVLNFVNPNRRWNFSSCIEADGSSLLTFSILHIVDGQELHISPSKPSPFFTLWTDRNVNEKASARGKGHGWTDLVSSFKKFKNKLNLRASGILPQRFSSCVCRRLRRLFTIKVQRGDDQGTMRRRLRYNEETTRETTPRRR